MRVVRPEHFVGDGRRGVYLNREGKRLYFAAYERELNGELAVDGERLSPRHLFRRQAHRLAAALTEGEPYRAFRLPC